MEFVDKKLVESAKIQTLVNGKTSKDIVCKRGLIRGDLLSLLPFVLVGDELNYLIRKNRGHKIA